MYRFVNTASTPDIESSLGMREWGVTRIRRKNKMKREHKKRERKLT